MDSDEGVVIGIFSAHEQFDALSGFADMHADPCTKGVGDTDRFAVDRDGGVGDADLIGG